MHPASITDAQGPVTVLFKRRVRPGREAEFEAWVSGITQAALQFPGHQGAAIIRPAGRGTREYVIIFRFNDYARAQDWENSDVRAEWVARVQPLTEGEAEIQRVSGLEFWFTPPEGTTRVPPRWKMALVTFIVLWPLNILVNVALGPVIAAWPIALRALVVVGVLVPLVTYLVMPWATRLFAVWLYPTNKH